MKQLIWVCAATLALATSTAGAAPAAKSTTPAATAKPSTAKKSSARKKTAVATPAPAPVPPPPAPAAEAPARNRISLRAAFGYGEYHVEAPSFSVDDHAKVPLYGVGIAYSRTLTPTVTPFADLGIEYSDISDANSARADFVRTDVAATVGARLFDIVAPFVGYRLAWQDPNKAFDDDIWQEHGWYLGAAAGSFALGPRLNLGASAAYNWNRVAPDAALFLKPFNYRGYSAKLRLGLSGTPHALELRYQEFSGDLSPGFDLTESYALAVYVFNWSGWRF